MVHQVHFPTTQIMPRLRPVLWLLVLLLPSCSPRKFRFAIGMINDNYDLSWTYRHNYGRVHSATALEEMFPDIEIQSLVQYRLLESFNATCDPQYIEWAEAKVELIIGNSFGFQDCLHRLAHEYPDSTFVQINGDKAGPDNWAVAFARVYQPLYIAGYVAGLMTETRKVCVIGPVNVTHEYRNIGAFLVGVHNVAPDVEVRVAWTGSWLSPALEVWLMEQFHRWGCDVMLNGGSSPHPHLRAERLGLMSVGFVADHRMTVGESVLTAGTFHWGPLYTEIATAVIQGTFRAPQAARNWWPGWDSGTVALADFSLRVPPHVRAAAAAERARVILPDRDLVFCGRLCSRSECFCANASCCLTDAQLRAMTWFPDFVSEHGLLRLPGEACGRGERALWDVAAFRMSCAACPPGSCAVNSGARSECEACPPGTFAGRGAVRCVPCPAGTASNTSGQVACPACAGNSMSPGEGARRCIPCAVGSFAVEGHRSCRPLSQVGLWLGVAAVAALGAVVAVALVLRSTRQLRRLQKLYSNDNVAAECAEAISKLDLNAVAWLSGIPHPNRIQRAFIQIIRILEEVRTYVPHQLLCALHPRDPNDDSDSQTDGSAPPPPKHARPLHGPLRAGGPPAFEPRADVPEAVDLVRDRELQPPAPRGGVEGGEPQRAGGRPHQTGEGPRRHRRDRGLRRRRRPLGDAARRQRGQREGGGPGAGAGGFLGGPGAVPGLEGADCGRVRPRGVRGRADGKQPPFRRGPRGNVGGTGAGGQGLVAVDRDPAVDHGRGAGQRPVRLPVPPAAGARQRDHVGAHPEDQPGAR